MYLEKLFLCEFHTDNFYLGATAAVTNGRRHGHPWRKKKRWRTCVEYNSKGNTFSWRKRRYVILKENIHLGSTLFKDEKKRKFLGFSFFFFLLYNTVLVLPYIDTNPPHGSLFKTNAAVSGSITKMKCGHLFNLVLQVCCISDCGPVLLGSLIMLVFMLYFHYLLLHYWLLYIFKAPSSMFQFAPQPFLL